MRASVGSRSRSGTAFTSDSVMRLHVAGPIEGCVDHLPPAGTGGGGQRGRHLGMALTVSWVSEGVVEAAS